MTMTHSSSEQSGENHLTKIESLVGEIIRYGGFDLKANVRRGNPRGEDAGDAGVVVDFEGRDSDLLLEKNAALLDALEYVVLKAVRVDDDLYGKIIFDCKDWRRVRAEELKLTALMAARQVIESGSPFSLTPMSARERRIIHMTLKDDSAVKTLSEGSGPARKVVIYPSTSLS